MLAIEAQHDRGLDLAGPEFEVPVAALAGDAGQVAGSGNIGECQRAEFVDQALAIFGRRQVTAVEQDVTDIAEGIGPQRDAEIVLLERLGIEAGIAEPHAAVTAVGNDMDGVEVVVSFQGLGYLRDTVAIALQHHDFEFAAQIHVGANVVDQQLVIVDAGIDEDDFVTAFLGLRGILATVVERCLVGVDILEQRILVELVADTQHAFRAAREQAPLLEFFEYQPGALPGMFRGFAHIVPFNPPSPNRVAN